MRLDHIAYRVADRHRSAEFFIQAFGYHLQTEFKIDFDDGSAAKCLALEPPEKPVLDNGFAVPVLPWSTTMPHGDDQVAYHLAPEIFISDGDPGSIVGQWVAARGGIGGIHHLAYQ